jgi:NAD(P)-dependent dehydrogenase (short-subunit alcohol dehydrogenase family)
LHRGYNSGRGITAPRGSIQLKDGISRSTIGFRMENKASQTVVITGASAGLGRAIAHSFAKRGARIALIARNPEALEAAREECERFGGRALVLPLDVSDAKALEAAAERVEQELGPIDVWVNNAMASVFSPVKEMEADEYRRVTEVTYLGYVYGTLAALRRMLTRDRGTIIQVGSALAYRSIPLQSAYCAAKHAIVGFTDSLRCELHHDKSNVKITVVQMPAMNTVQFDWVKSRLPKRYGARRRPPIRAGNTGWGTQPAKPSLDKCSCPDCSIATWAQPAMTRSNTAAQSTRTGRIICGITCRAGIERMVISTRDRTTAACKRGWTFTAAGSLAVRLQSE